MLRPALITTALALALTGCGSSGATSSGAKATTTVKAGDTSCELGSTSFAAGTIAFQVQNVGKDTTEVYVYGKGSGGAFDKVVGEVENIAPGTSRDFDVKATGGSYEVACKPGQSGDGVRTTITVSGASSEAEAAYDREVEVELTASGLEGFDAFPGKAGEKVEIKLANKGTEATEELELLDPTGKVLGVINAVEAGKNGQVVVELGAAGTYSYVLELKSGDKKGTFTVA